MRTRWWLLLIVLVAALGWLVWHRRQGAGEAGMPAGMGGPAPVSVARALRLPFREQHEYNGQLVAVADVEVRPQVGGTIEKVLFSEGSLVNAGDPLFVLDLRPFRLAAAQAEAQAKLAAQDIGRYQRLRDENAVSGQQVDQAAAAAAVARAAAARARLDLDYAVIKAPISGRVGRPEITVGNVVSAGAGAPVLTRIQTRDPIYADFEISEQDYLRLPGAGQTPLASTLPVAMALANGSDFDRDGRLLAFDNRLQPGAGTLRVRAVFDNPDGRLLPGLTARVRLGAAQETDVVAVNDKAILTDQSKRNVFVIASGTASNSLPMYREVTPGELMDGDNAGLRVIRQGLQAGEQVVVDGVQRVHPGMPVTPQPVDMRTLKPAQGTSGSIPRGVSAATAVAH